MKLDTPEGPSAVPTSNGSSESQASSRAATVQDEDDDEMDQDFAPGGDADYFAEEDDEGRFFGGGLTSEQKDILNIFDKAGGEEARDELDELNLQGVRRLLLKVRACSEQEPGPEVQVS
ncbi:hypothetical protein QCA50_000491 [Cerrena zonata]|uniref:Uncharacterized protein n=1 Tax=Cerrena zonata TaxID=2478898 RepID=A0AAW0GY08_9APHY